MSSATVPLEIERSLGTWCPACRNDSAVHFLRAPDRFHGRKDVYRLVRCLHCGLVRLSDPPAPKEMGIHYGSEYHASIEQSGERDLLKRWKAQRKRVMSLKSGGSILDIGCSSGAFLQTLKGEPWKLHGIEISELEAARARTQAGAEVFVGDPLDAPYSPESFDVITCFHLLEHVYQPLELLKKVREWLKPGGLLYVILPNVDAWEARIFGSYWYGLELPRHLFHFSPTTLGQIAESGQLYTVRLTTRVEDSFIEHSIHYLFDDLLRWLGKPRPPMAADVRVSFPTKILRKLFRLSIVTIFRHAAWSVRHGACIEAVFIKL
jgi:SAM-dependent methyltransferase